MGTGEAFSARAETSGVSWARGTVARVAAFSARIENEKCSPRLNCRADERSNARGARFGSGAAAQAAAPSGVMADLADRIAASLGTQ
ncbi:MAG TPA: hypothetical protein VNZ04_14115 [Trinickia sp.]|nr:hypothetical protein [Trinickia sp.]